MLCFWYCDQVSPFVGFWFNILQLFGHGMTGANLITLARCYKLLTTAAGHKIPQHCGYCELTKSATSATVFLQCFFTSLSLVCTGYWSSEFLLDFNSGDHHLALVILVLLKP